MLVAVAALVRAGLADEWNANAAGALAQVIAARDDIRFEDVQEVTGEVVSNEAPRQGRAKAFLTKVSEAGLGGALGIGISAGVAEVLASSRSDSARPGDDERGSDSGSTNWKTGWPSRAGTGRYRPHSICAYDGWRQRHRV